MNSNITYEDKEFSIKTFDDHIGKQIKTGYFYEYKMLYYIHKNIPNKGKYIDVGANIGNHSMFFASFCNAEVIALEPVKDNYDLLVFNSIGKNILPINKAVGKQEGKCSFEINQNNMGMCKMIEGKDVDIITIDSLNLTDVTLIKIDVEGSEKDVIEGALKTISLNRPHIFIETSDPHKIVAMLYNYKVELQFNRTPTYYLKP
jgi:FkbM family methyltransferase